MLIGYKRGQTSIVLRVKILNSSVTTGAGLTGLTSASSGLIISTIADNEATATTYTVAGSTIESITTLGTYATPTATKCRFKEVDSTNHKGVYEIQLADARYGVSSAKSLLVSIVGATNAAETDVVIPLRDLDPYDSVRAGLTALPNAAAEAAGGLYTRGSGAGQINQATNGQIDGNLVRIANVAVSTSTAQLGVNVVNVAGSAVNALISGRVDATVGAYQSGLTPLQPTTAGRTLDVTATGEAGIDWANIGGPTTSVNLSGTTIATSQVVASVTGAVGSVTGAVGSVTGAVGSVTAAVATTSNVKKNQALSNFQFLMTDSTNHAPATGKSVTVTRGIDGGSQASGTLSAVTEISNGLYRVDFGSGDLNGNVITLRATASGCDDTFERIVTQP